MTQVSQVRNTAYGVREGEGNVHIKNVRWAYSLRTSDSPQIHKKDFVRLVFDGFEHLLLQLSQRVLADEVAEFFPWDGDLYDAY